MSCRQRFTSNQSVTDGLWYGERSKGTNQTYLSPSLHVPNILMSPNPSCWGERFVGDKWVSWTNGHWEQVLQVAATLPALTLIAALDSCPPTHLFPTWLVANTHLSPKTLVWHVGVVEKVLWGTSWCQEHGHGEQVWQVGKGDMFVRDM